MIKFGHALKETIDALPDDLNIAIFSSGGFTHSRSTKSSITP